MMNNEEKYISLIIKAGEDVAHLKKEIIALRYALIKHYPNIKNELLSDLTTSLEIDDLYVSITNMVNYNPLDCDEYRNDIKQLTKQGYTNHYPFSI